MQPDPVTLLLAIAGIAVAVLLAIVAGTISARLFFHASGLDPADAATSGKKTIN